MSKATIADIALRAGLSTATVDRALNGRKGVSAANRHRVLKAAEDLGVLPSEGMVRLPSRPANLAFLIPFGQNSFMRDLAQSITNLSTGLPLVASCTIVTMDGIGPDALERALDAVSPHTHGVGIITTDHPRSRAAVSRLCESGVRVVTIASDLTDTPRSSYVGVDNRIAGRTAGQLMGMLTRGRSGGVAVFLGSRRFQGHSQRELGFRDFLREHLPGLNTVSAIETAEDNRRSNAATLELLRRRPDIAGIYCVGASRTGIVEAIEGLGSQRPSLIMHDLTDSSREWLKRQLVDVVIDQNPRLVGEQAVIHLLGSIAASTPYLSLKHIESRIILSENVTA